MVSKSNTFFHSNEFSKKKIINLHRLIGFLIVYNLIVELFFFVVVVDVVVRLFVFVFFNKFQIHVEYSVEPTQLWKYTKHKMFIATMAVF